jgi:hypothetical protein
MGCVRSALCIFVATVLNTQAPQAGSAEDGWLRLSRTQIMRIFDVSNAQPCPRNAKSSRDVARLQAEGDTIWIAVILYAATARQECIPRSSHSSDPMDDPIQRVVC